MGRVRAPLSLADLADAFRLLRPVPAQAERIAQALGFEVGDSGAEGRLADIRRPAGDVGAQRPEPPSASLPATPQAADDRPTEGLSTSLQTRQLRAPRRSFRPPRHIRQAQPPPIRPQGELQLHPPAPMLPRRLWRTFLLDAVGDELPDDSIDIDEAVERLARYHLHRPLPRRRVKGFRSGLQLWVDDGPAMQPFLHDVREMGRAVRRIVGPGYEGEFFFDRPPLAGDKPAKNGRAAKATKLRGGLNLLLLTDLGIGHPPMTPRVRPERWLAFARELKARGVRAVAVVPYGPERWPREIQKWVKIVQWSATRSRPAEDAQDRVRPLARVLSLAAHIDPALLREARRHFYPDSDAGLEADLIHSAFVSVSNPRAVAFHREALLELRAEMEQDPPGLQRAFNFLQAYRRRAGFDSQHGFEEELVIQCLTGAPGARGRVRAGLSGLARLLVDFEGSPALCRWVLGCLQELPEWVNELNEAHDLRNAAGLRLGFDPAGFDPSRFSGRDSWLLPPPTHVGLRLSGNDLTFREPPEPNDPVIEVPATNPRVLFVRGARGSLKPVRFKIKQPATVKIQTLPVDLDTLAGARLRVEGTKINRGPLPRGVKRARTLRGHEGVVGRIRWAHGGRFLASPSTDSTVGVWDADGGTMLRKLDDGHWGFPVNCVCWSPDAQRLASGGDDHRVNVWESMSGRLLRNFEGHQRRVWDVAWSPDGRVLASASADGTILLWDAAQGGRAIRTLEGHGGDVTGVAWSPDGGVLASSSWDGTVRLWDASSGQASAILEGHTAGVTSVCFLPDATLLASAGLDKTIRVWDVRTQKLVRVLEGHTGNVKSLAVSSDGQCLASKAGGHDDTVRLWSCNTWETVAVIQEVASQDWSTGIDFHPTLPILATVGSGVEGRGLERDTLIHIWALDLAVLLGKATPQAVQHTTAKIVLVGDSGVGKSGLGWRLAQRKFREQPATHGQQFWVLPELGRLRADGTECEAVLWDLAGQSDYRLTHALFLDQVDLALVLFDLTDSRDPLRGVEYWLRQLRAGPAEGGGQADYPIILVGARADRGEPALTREEIDEFCRRNGVRGYVSTSAKDARGLEELVRLMRESIPWDDKPATVTTITFKRIKDYILWLKENKRQGQPVVMSMPELRKRLEKTSAGWRFTGEEMLSAAGSLENYGYVRRLHTSKGEDLILLAPELLNNLAGSLVMEARRNPKGLGSVEEKRLLAGGYKFFESEKLAPAELDVLLDTVVLLFLERNICFRETDLGGQTYLVFPELINLKRPLLEDESTEDGPAYTVTGAVENVYARLVVLLGYTQTFTRTDQWQNQARYEVGEGLICGFRLDAERDGELDFVLFFGTTVGKPVRTLFQGLFESFLARRGLSVFRFEPISCSNGHPVATSILRDRVRRGVGTTFCSTCGVRIGLPDASGPIQLTGEEQRKVGLQILFAERRASFEQAVFRLSSYVADQKLPRPECFISYAWGDREQERWVERLLAADLQKAGIGVLLDKWEGARVGESIPRFIKRIENCDHFIVVGTPLYRKKFESKDTTTGALVGAEVDLISARLTGTQAQKERVIPLLLAGEKTLSLPPLLQGKVFADFRDEEDYYRTAFDLILNIYRISLNHPAVADLRESLREPDLR